VLGIRSKMQLKGSALKNAKKLLAVGCFCIGTNQVDLEVGSLSHHYSMRSSLQTTESALPKQHAYQGM
jgi:phosphoglycerate dehydrogenase-like enzyme